jgi:hypothetical protein
MGSWLNSPAGMIAVLVIVGLLAAGVSLWRVLQGSPGQRARGLMSLLMLGVGIAVVLWALHAFAQVSGTIGGPGQSGPGTEYPTVPTGPSFATPANVISGP